MVPRRARPAATVPPALSPQPVLYRSSALAATCPELAFRRRPSARIAAAAAQADACRDKFKVAQELKSGCADQPGDSEAVRDSKKYRRRLLLNRHSAGASRLRKEAYVGALEKELADLEGVYEALKEKTMQSGALTDEVRSVMTSAEADDGQERLAVETLDDDDDAGKKDGPDLRSDSVESECVAKGEDAMMPTVEVPVLDAVSLPSASTSYLPSFQDPCPESAFELTFPLHGLDSPFADN